jgi:vacuolar-type H+-ATPase subunit E/Vma4
MGTVNQDEGEGLRNEILVIAHLEADRILNQAQQNAHDLLTRNETAENKAAEEKLTAALQEAARRKEQILATLPVETARLHAARMESLLQSLHDEIQRRLQTREGFDYREALVACAAYAIRRMAGDSFVVEVSPNDHRTLGESLTGEITRRGGRSDLRVEVVPQPSIHEGGLIVWDRERRQVWDNRLTVRLERLWPELRRQAASAIVASLKHNSQGDIP